MMKKMFLFTITFCTYLHFTSKAQQGVTLVTTDIDHFWQAYDKITLTKDSSEQYGYLNKLFIEKVSPGQLAMFKARNYTQKDYISVIGERQAYFNSIRSNSLKVNKYAQAIEAKLKKFKKLYPELRPAKIYFTVGAFRSGGTTTGDMVLIGSEIAMADEHLADLVATNVHEYVHTQQKSNSGENLLAQSVMEGVAEFVAEQVMSKASIIPAFIYGKTHGDTIRKVFAQQMFNSGNGFWLYSDARNPFGARDLGYYVGYSIAQKYHQKSLNKKLAIKEMIELDITDNVALEAYVDRSGYFDSSVKALKAEYESRRPEVISATPLRTGSSATILNYTFTINFSREMDKRFRNFEMGPLGKDHLMDFKRFTGFAPDGKSASFEVEVKPGIQYQLIIGSGFRDLYGLRIHPYLIDFKP